MIAVDTNVLVYAHRPDGPFHVEAKTCVDSLAAGRAPWAIPWPCLHEFIGVVTHPKVLAPPTSLADALDQVGAWLESPTLVLLSESGDYWSMLVDVATSGRVVGPRIHDARIVALCRAFGVRELWSADRDFARFPGITVRNPLATAGVHERAAPYAPKRRATTRLRRTARR